MTLSGLNRITVRPRGGISKVELVPAADFAGTATAPVEYVFREDGARYSETLEGEPLQPLVRHTLEMVFPAGEASRRAVAELLSRSAEGFVATVTTAGGERLIAGRSERFGVAYPLRVAKVASVSGSGPADLPAITLTLESTDADPAEIICLK